VTATAILDLERAGFTREQVEALGRLLEAQVATKLDLAALRSELQGDIARVELRLAETKAELRGEIRGVVMWVVGTALAQLGLLITVLKLFPGHL
jgi:hypothetical protein